MICDNQRADDVRHVARGGASGQLRRTPEKIFAARPKFEIGGETANRSSSAQRFGAPPRALGEVSHSQTHAGIESDQIRPTSWVSEAPFNSVEAQYLRLFHIATEGFGPSSTRGDCPCFPIL